MWHKKSRVGWFFMDMHRNHLRLQDRYFTVLDTPDCKLTIFASTLAITISWVLPAESYDRENPYLIEITVDNVATHIGKVAAGNESLPNIKTYELWSDLLLLCQADASAQTEFVYRDGVLVDSREHKLKKVDAIRIALEGVFS